MSKKVSAHTFLEFYSRKIVKIAVPVIITLILDAILIRIIEETSGSAQLNRNFVDTMSRSDSGMSVSTSIWTAVILIVNILVVTAILLLLYYYGCMKIIFGWLILAVILLLSMYVLVAFGNIPEIMNIPVDYISLVIFLGNLCAVGVMSIFWRAPKIVTQLYMILISILTSLVFRYLPDWTVWVLLLLLVVYDACVVLCPGGLLNLLLKKSEERGDAIPALIYSTAAYYWHEKSCSGSGDGAGNAGNEDENQENVVEEEEETHEHPAATQNPAPVAAEATTAKPKAPLNPINETLLDDEPVEDPENPQDKDKKKKMSNRENDGIKLGLGDFVFYGILITRAARIGWDITVLCIFAVILGLSLTLVVLALFERPLPALPFSLILGIIFFIIGTMTFRQFDDLLRGKLVAF